MPTLFTRERFSPIEYTHVTIKLPEGRVRQAWALEQASTTGRLRFFRVYHRDGEKTNEMLVATPGDVLAEEPARMSLMYARMEKVRFV